MKHLAFERAGGAGIHLEIESAGTGADHVGEPSDPRARAAAAERGIRLEERAQQFRPSDLGRFDLVLAMDAQNLNHLRRLATSPEQEAKVFLLRDFDPDAAPGAEVPDPYYGGEAGFDEVLDLCERACRGLLRHLETQGMGAAGTS